MQIFEKNKKLKINFTSKGVYDKADVELYPNDNGEAVLEVNGQAGGGLPEGGNKGDVLTLISAGSAAEGKLITDGVTPIHKLFLNKEALFEYLPQLNYDSESVDVYLTDIAENSSGDENLFVQFLLRRVTRSDFYEDQTEQKYHIYMISPALEFPMSVAVNPNDLDVTLTDPQGVTCTFPAKSVMLESANQEWTGYILKDIDFSKDVIKQVFDFATENIPDEEKIEYDESDITACINECYIDHEIMKKMFSMNEPFTDGVRKADWAPSNLTSDILKCTFKRQSPDSYALDCDKSFTEIRAALEAGKFVYTTFKMDNSYNILIPVFPGTGKYDEIDFMPHSYGNYIHGHFDGAEGWHWDWYPVE